MGQGDREPSGTRPAFGSDELVGEPGVGEGDGCVSSRALHEIQIPPRIAPARSRLRQHGEANGLLPNPKGRDHRHATPGEM
jgi:hypothetical protein